jgi:hypothetical protein
MADDRNTKQDQSDTPKQPQKDRQVTASVLWAEPNVYGSGHVHAYSYQQKAISPKWFRRSDVWVAIFTGMLVAIGIVTSILFLRQLGEMGTENNTAQKQLELSERPWIKIVDVKTLGNDSLIPALSFQGFGYGFFPSGNKQVTFQLTISLRNIGHSLAFVTADFELFLPAWTDKFEDTLLNEEKRFCDASAQKAPNKYLNRIVFPDEPLDWGGAGVQKVAPPMLPGNVLNHIPGDAKGDYILPTIIACANYTFPSSSHRYQTRTLFIVVHQENGVRFFRTGIDVPERNLRIIRDDIADDAY